MNKILDRIAIISNRNALIIGLALGLGYYFGAYNDGSELQAQIQVVSKKLAEAQTKKKETDAILKEEERMKDSIGKLSEQYAFISKKLPSDLKSADMVRSIDNVAKVSGVSIKVKKPGAVEKKEIIEELPVDVVFEGNYGQVASFIYHLSNSERLTRFMNFTMSTQEEGKKALRVEGQVISYKLAPEVPEKKDDANAPGGKPAGTP